MDGNFTKIELKHIKLFVKFLKKNGVYNIYFKNLTEIRHNYFDFVKNMIKYGTPEDLIMYAFGWDNTEEGSLFWATLNNDWCNIISNKKT
jgi:hypothetical protein